MPVLAASVPPLRSDQDVITAHLEAEIQACIRNQTKYLPRYSKHKEAAISEPKTCSTVKTKFHPRLAWTSLAGASHAVAAARVRPNSAAHLLHHGNWVPSCLLGPAIGLLSYTSLRQVPCAIAGAEDGELLPKVVLSNSSFGGRGRATKIRQTKSVAFLSWIIRSQLSPASAIASSRNESGNTSYTRASSEDKTKENAEQQIQHLGEWQSRGCVAILSLWQGLGIQL